MRAGFLALAILLWSGCSTARKGALPGHVQQFETIGGEVGPTVVVIAGGSADQEFPIRAARQIANWPLRRGRLISITVDAPSMPDGMAARIRALKPDWEIELREDFYHPRPGLNTQGGTVFNSNAATEAWWMMTVVNASLEDSKNHFRTKMSLIQPIYGGHTMRLVTSARRNTTPTREFRAAPRIRQHRLMVHALLERLGMLAPTAKVDQFLPCRREGKIFVAVYDGAGSGNPMPFCTDLMNGLPQVEAHPVSPVEIRNGALAQFDVALFPGGMASAQFDALGAKGRAAVQDFVRDGGGYVGICAGAYMAAAQPYQWGLDLLDAKIVDHDHWARGIGPVKIELSARGNALFSPRTGPMEYHYGNGPILAPGGKAGIPDYEVLAWYRTGIGRNGADPKVMVGTPAIVRGRLGKGRVLVSSGHAEWSTGLESFLLRYIEWAAGGNFPTLSAAP